MDLWTVKEWSARVGIHFQTTYKLIYAEEIRAAKRKGAGWRILEDPDEWVKNGSHKQPGFAETIKKIRAILNTSLDGDIGVAGGQSEMPKGKSETRRNFGYGAIYPRKTKQGIIRWYLDYRNSKGERVQRVAGHAITARDAGLALKQEVLRALSEKGGSEVKRIGFKEFSKEYLQKHIMGHRRNSVSDQCRLKKLEKYFGANKDLREITPMVIDGFVRARQRAGNSGGTSNRYLALLRHLLNKAIGEGYLEDNPARKIKFFQETSRRERVLSPEEEKKLLTQSSGYLKSALIIALNSGLRLSEILNLQWKQIDFTAQKIKVIHTKSGRPRDVFINAPLLEELTRMSATKGKSAHLFLNPQTHKPITLIRRSFLAACRRAGITGLTFHSLRHTFCSRLLERGADIETVKCLAGHHSIVVTSRYTHSSDGAKKRAVELLNEEPEKDPEKEENLLHRCDMGKTAPAERTARLPLNHSFSWN
jgi:integrase